MSSKHDKYNKTAKGRYRALKRAAKTKGSFNISFWEFVEVLAAPCAYCGTEDKGSTGSGVDRINSKKGYTKHNIKSCCGACNTMKSTLTEAQFYKHIQTIVANLKLK